MTKNFSVDFENMTIVIDGVEYNIVKKENVEKRNKVIVTMETPFGCIQGVHDRDGFPIGEGDYEHEGYTFHVEFVTEDEIKDKIIGKPIDEADPLELALLGLAMELE